MSERERLARRAAGGDAAAARRLADMLSGGGSGKVWLALEYGAAEDERAGYTGQEYQLAEILGVFSSRLDALLACASEALRRSLTRTQARRLEAILDDLDDLDDMGDEIEATLNEWNELVPDRYRIKFVVEAHAVDAVDPRAAIRERLEAMRPQPSPSPPFPPFTDPPWPSGQHGDVP